MLYTLLTLLLPYWASPAELDFHEQFVLTTYREYYDCLVGSGYRDHKVVSKIKKQTAYSMSMLFWRKPGLWMKIRRFHKQVVRLKKSVLPLKGALELPKLP